MTRVDTRFYHESLLEMARAARAFASAIENAAACAARVPGIGDDQIAARVMGECSAALAGAFARAPAMIQVLTGKVPAARAKGRA